MTSPHPETYDPPYPPSVHRAGADGAGPGAAVAAAPPRQAPDLPVRLYGPQAEADPFGMYEMLRSRFGALAPVLLEGDVPGWLVLGYHENAEAARTTARFSRDSRIWRDWRAGRVPADSPLIPMLGWRPDCVSQDGADHQRLRAAVNDSLGRFDRHGVRRHIQRYADQLIDGFVRAGSADLVAQYAEQLPMLVLTRLLGLPEELGPPLVEASNGLIKGGERALEFNGFVLDTLRRLTEDKRAAPGHDFASWLIEHPAGLSDDEVQHHLRLVMVAANETTTNLVANTLRMVLTDPRFRASLTGGLMTVPDAVEQVLWDEAPLAVCPARFATADMEFGGRRVRAGDLVLLGLAAGNTDPAVRPDRSTPVHGNRSHLAFSRGPHECPGQDIGRAITDIAVDALLSRVPDIRLAVGEEQLSWSSSTWSRHLNALPARFTPGRARSGTGEAGRVEVGADPHAAAGAKCPVDHGQVSASDPDAVAASARTATAPAPASASASGSAPAPTQMPASAPTPAARPVPPQRSASSADAPRHSAPPVRGRGFRARLGGLFRRG